jgi:hypothetical protein
MKILKKNHYLTFISKISKKLPKKPFDNLPTHLQMLHMYKISHKTTLQYLETMSYFSIICYKDASSKHPKCGLGVNINLLIKCVKKDKKL